MNPGNRWHGSGAWPTQREKADMGNRSDARFVLNGARPGDKPFRQICCWPDCEEPSGIEGIPLCIRHHIKAWRTLKDSALWPLQDMRDDAFSLAQSIPSPQSRPFTDPGHVYFIRFGDRVKIGFTTNMKQRMATLPHDQILGVVPGTMADERRCHAAFTHLRITGEWFKAERELLDFIADVAQPYGPAGAAT